jgi:DNA-binding GntR family transcriptional regulator
LDLSFPAALQQQLEAAIVRGDYARGSTLRPGQLVQDYGASAADAERVLSAAYRKGLIKPLAAVEGGYLVLGPARASFSSVFTHTSESGLQPRSLVRQVEILPATAEMAEKLEVAVGSPVYRYVRTRYVNEEALANQINYMPLEVCPGLEHDDVTRYSFQKLLENKYCTIFAGMKERYLLIEANDEDCEILGLAACSTILLIERVALSATNRPVVWANIRIRPDRYSYVAALWPEAAELLAADGGPAAHG